MDVRKTVTDAGYIAIGLGVMGIQQAQVRAEALRTHVSGTGTCIAGKAKNASERLSAHGAEARGKAEEQVTVTVSKVQELAGEVSGRVEPIFVQVQATVAELPEKLVQAIEPMAALVRERIKPAA